MSSPGNFNARQFISGSVISLVTVFQDQLGNLLDVDGAAVTVIGPGNQLFLVDQMLNRDGYGTFSYNWTSPQNMPVGYYQEIYEGFTAGHIRKSKAQFEIVASDAFNRPPAPTTRVGQMLDILRDALADNIPNVRRKQWDDEELLNFLTLAMLDINAFPAITSYDLNSAPFAWTGLIIEGAVALALRAWIIDYALYDVDFNDNGLSVSIRNTLDHYMTLYNDAVQRFQDNAKLLKKNTRPRGQNIISGLVAFNVRSLRMSQLLSIVNQR